MIRKSEKLKKEVLKDIAEERWTVHSAGDELSEQDRNIEELKKASFRPKTEKKQKGL